MTKFERDADAYRLRVEQRAARAKGAGSKKAKRRAMHARRVIEGHRTMIRSGQ